MPEVQLRASPEWGHTAPPSPQILDRGAFHLEKFAYRDVRQRPALLTIAYARCLQHWVEKQNLLRNQDFHPWAECMSELWQTMREFVNITNQDVMQGLEIEKPEASHPQPGATIFSRALSTLDEEPKVMEDPPHLDSPPPKDEVIWCASAPWGLGQSDKYLLVVTSKANWLGPGAGGNNVRGSMGGGSLFQNPQMSAVFPPPWEGTRYEGTTLTKLNE